MTITIPVWLLWTLGGILGAALLMALGFALAVFIANRIPPWR